MTEHKQVTYIALLRGINVGGHIVTMDKLRTLFSDLQFTHIRSYIQSGNIFFETDEKDEGKIQKRIEEHLQKSLGYAVPVCLRTIEEIENLLQHNPFKEITITPEIRLAVTFLSQYPKENIPVPFITPDGGYEVIGKSPKELFVVWHIMNGRPGNSYGLLEKKAQVPTTTRFWHTLAKIFAAAKKSN